MTDDQLIIRWAEPRDIDSLAEFNRRLADETEEMSLDLDTLRRGIGRLLDDPRRGRYLVAERAGTIVGQLMHTYEWSDWRDGDIWWIQSVYVDASHRSQGIYRRLHEHLRQQAINDGEVVGIRLYVENDNHRAADVYKRLGMASAPYRVMQEIFTPAGR
jgi:ribosomal protein S18 acetylase RimI-like enzyme